MNLRCILVFLDVCLIHRHEKKVTAKCKLPGAKVLQLPAELCRNAKKAQPIWLLPIPTLFDPFASTQFNNHTSSCLMHPPRLKRTHAVVLVNDLSSRTCVPTMYHDSIIERRPLLKAHNAENSIIQSKSSCRVNAPITILRPWSSTQPIRSRLFVLCTTLSPFPSGTTKRNFPNS